MKKSVCLFLIVLLVGLMLVVSVHAATGIPAGAQDIGKTITEEGAEKYLEQEWQKILENNKLIGPVNNFLKKISFVFVIFLGEQYTLSLTFLLVVFLWFYLFFKFSEVFSNFTPLSAGVAWIIGLLFAILLGHIGVIREIAEFFIWLVLSSESKWYRAILGGVIFIVLVIIYYISSVIGSAYKHQKKLGKEAIKQAKLTGGAKIAEEMIFPKKV